MNGTHNHPATAVDFRKMIDWYRSHCDDSWEHHYGVRLETLDNPGWLLTVDLTGTELEEGTFSEIREGIAPGDHPDSLVWFHCYVCDNRFLGASDPTQVARLFEVFYQFLHSHHSNDRNA